MRYLGTATFKATMSLLSRLHDGPKVTTLVRSASGINTGRPLVLSAAEVKVKGRHASLTAPS